jgi:adenosylcobinamide amidohydrolase
VRLSWPDDALVADFGAELRCLSSAVLNGGFTLADGWLNLQVGHDYARTDPEVHLREAARARGLDPERTIGMLTAADVRAGVLRDRGLAHAVATVGIGQPLAAAGQRPRPIPPRAGTINVLIVVEAALTDAALVTAVQTATEAKAQALADAGVLALNHSGHATGTATDAICIAAPIGDRVRFAGPSTPVGAAIALAVHSAVRSGARVHQRTIAAMEDVG